MAVGHDVGWFTYKITSYSIIININIDQKYGLEPLPKHLVVPTSKFPAPIKERLLAALDKPGKPWGDMNIDAFGQGRGVCLRVTLDVGDRPLHLFAHEDGDVLQFDAPVLRKFPEKASHLVLTKLCGNNTYISFRVDEEQVHKGKQQGEPNEVLYGWGRFEFNTFVASAFALLPYLIIKLTEAELELRSFLDSPPSQFERAV